MKGSAGAAHLRAVALLGEMVGAADRVRVGVR